ncbi:carbohydrate ABC transporter permease [Actinokineospora auranticolor]|uniref:ABC-type glycerol-3-phosphate transport system permease component n=1 Tax=Actinokineospora auranticolor TaxID=155976 RepID=A0A2S6GFW4_9PSEU|nr:carbohydrate ABC transporter permease [Actinokineospora auranticolor]PPK64104.1 ABC-type glycerol-3-phosphate transport system permease component [Actinokineospora auranticolor]
MTAAAVVSPVDDEAVGESGRARSIAGHVVLTLLSVACVFPIYWLYATSLRAPEDVYSLSVLPWPLSLENYADAFAKTDMVGMLVNTTVMAVLTALGQLLVALLAAYAFAAWRFRFQKLLYLMFVGTWLVPFQVTMLPNYVLLSRLDLLDTLAGVIIPTLCSAMGVLLLRQHLMGFPKELLDAARMDGRSSWGILWTVVVPTLRPVLAALGILLAITAWNEYFWPALVLRRGNDVVQLGLRSFMGTEGNDWGPLMATAGLTCLPVFLLYLVLQRHIVNAFVRSGLK